jgi:dienelactone hydrolase
MDVYVAGAGPRAVVLVYDIMGMSPSNTQHNCDVLAAAGFLVVIRACYLEGPWGSHRTPSHPVDDPLDPLQ